MFLKHTTCGAQEEWASLTSMIVVMEQIEKNSHKKYEQLQLLKPQTASTDRLLNEFEDRAHQSLNIESRNGK